jgi:hypothetical protein
VAANYHHCVVLPQVRLTYVDGDLGKPATESPMAARMKAVTTRCPDRRIARLHPCLRLYPRESRPQPAITAAGHQAGPLLCSWSSRSHGRLVSVSFADRSDALRTLYDERDRYFALGVTRYMVDELSDEVAAPSESDDFQGARCMKLALAVLQADLGRVGKTH